MRLRALLPCLLALPAAAPASEPGSGVYAEDCSAPASALSIDIAADGSATVVAGGATFAGLRTSASFLGKEAPEDFRVAILFDKAASPFPVPEGKDASWIEIWNGETDFYALVDGAAEPQLSFCGDLAAFAPPKQTVDCAAGTGVARLICDTPGLAASDQQLAEAVAAAHDNTDAAGLPKLEADQAAWTRTRDACAGAEDPAACLAEAYRTRIALLSAGYGLATAGATETYACKDRAVTRLDVVPFDTDPPSVNLMVGQTRVTALLQPDGASYRAPTGEGFAPGERRARLDWPKGRTIDCTEQ